MKGEHVWKERTESGEKREVRTHKEGGKWRFQSKLETDEHWTYHDRPDPADLRALIDVLERKYRRKRVSYDDILLAKRLLQESRG